MILEIAISMCLVATPADGDDEGPISCVLSAPQYAAAVVNHRQLKQAASESIYAATGSISDPTPAPGVKPKAL